jgi:hypothetical protein
MEGCMEKERPGYNERHTAWAKENGRIDKFLLELPSFGVLRDNMERDEMR